MSCLNRLLLSENSLSASTYQSDACIIWEDVRCVDILSDGGLSCPICLEKPEVTQILECGHVFCLRCVLLHFTTSCSCCVCNHYATSKDLRSARVQEVSGIEIGTVRTFQLVETNRGISLPYGRSVNQIPCESVVGWWFSRIVTISDELLCIHHRGELRVIEDQHPFESHEGIYAIGSVLAIEFLHARIDSLNAPCDNIPTSLMVQIDMDALSSEILVEYGGQSDSFAYQSVDGQHVYLEPVWMRALLFHFCQSPDAWDKAGMLPPSLALPVVFTSALIVDQYSRQRYRQLNHLGLGTSVVLVDVDLRGIVAPAVLEALSDSITRRLQLIKRVKTQRRKDKRDLSREQAVPLSLDWSSNFEVYPTQSLPTARDFAHSLNSNKPVCSPVVTGLATYAEALNSGFADSAVIFRNSKNTKKGLKFRLAG